MGNKIVAKFGGSSVKDADAMRACVSIVKQTPDLCALVISATWNTTNLLEKIAQRALAKDDENSGILLKKLYTKHKTIIDDLDLSDELSETLSGLCEKAGNLATEISSKQRIDPVTMDSMYAIGELISSSIFAACLSREINDREVVLFDMRDVLITNSNFNKASPLLNETKKMAMETILPGISGGSRLFVGQGFIGRDVEGRTTTLGREGSDLSGSVLAWAVDACKLHIWTDVPGVATADPKFVKQVRWIPEMSYDEAQLLSTFGAKVLFERTLGPVINKNIPVFIGSTLCPNEGGTWITSEIDTNRRVTGLVLREDQSYFSVKHDGNEEAEKGVLKILEDFNVTYDFFRNDGLNISFLINDKNLNVERFCDSLYALGFPVVVEKETGLSLLSVVGNFKNNGNVVEKLEKYLSSSHFPILKLNETENYYCVLVGNECGRELLKQLHELLCQ